MTNPLKRIYRYRPKRKEKTLKSQAENGEYLVSEEIIDVTWEGQTIGMTVFGVYFHKFDPESWDRIKRFTSYDAAVRFARGEIENAKEA